MLSSLSSSHCRCRHRPPQSPCYTTGRHCCPHTKKSYSTNVSHCTTCLRGQNHSKSKLSKTTSLRYTGRWNKLTTNNLTHLFAFVLIKMTTTLTTQNYYNPKNNRQVSLLAIPLSVWLLRGKEWMKKFENNAELQQKLEHYFQTFKLTP